MSEFGAGGNRPRRAGGARRTVAADTIEFAVEPVQEWIGIPADDGGDGRVADEMAKAAWARRSAVAVMLLGLADGGTAVAAPADTARGLVGHRAVYEMGLGRRNDRSDVMEASGRLVYEFSGSPCDGWSSRFRLVTRLVNTDGTARVSDMRTTSFEDGDGRSLDFVNQNLVDGRTIEDVKGVAKREASAIRVTVAGAEGKSFEIAAAARFPTEHMVEVLEAAKAGRSVLEIDLYDGSEGGRRPFRTTVVIGSEITGPDDTSGEAVAATSPLLAGTPRRWPVEVSYFDPTKGTGEPTPEYQLGFLLYDNGIARRLRLDYGDFAISGTLTGLDGIASPACK